MKQTLQISKKQAVKLEEVMKKISGLGVDSITREKAVEHCIDWIYFIVNESGRENENSISENGNYIENLLILNNLVRKLGECEARDTLANIKNMTDKQLSEKLAELTNYEGMDQYDEPCYTYEPASSLEIQDIAIKSDPNGYVTNLSIVAGVDMFWDGIEDRMSSEGISSLLSVSSRLRAEAAYMTLNQLSVLTREGV